MRRRVAEHGLLLVIARQQPGQEFPTQAAHRAGGDEGRVQVPDPDRGVDPSAGQGRHDRAGEVALLQGADTRPGGGHLGDELLVAGTLEDRDGQVLDPDVVGECDAPEVVGDRVVQVEGAPRAWPGHELLDLRDRGQSGKASRLDRDHCGHGVDVAACYLAGALDGVCAEVYLPIPSRDHHAVREVGLMARAQHHGARQHRALERIAHRRAGGLADPVWVTFAEKRRADQRRGLGDMDELK